MERTILIVDDEEIDRKILGRMLGNDYNILYASNGKEAINEIINNAEILSAVLLDILMPDMNGYEVLQILHADKVLSQIPVIVTSTVDNDEDEVKALSLGAKDYIRKPYKTDIVRHRLANIIDFRETASMINTARKDDLTGLYNKQYFIKKVEQKLNTCPNEQFDLLCFDIDQFKLINDNYGIAAGDKLLRYVADIIKKDFPEITISSRFGADIFYELVSRKVEYTPEMVKVALEKMEDYPLPIKIKVRCGIYRISNPSISVSVMCDRAKIAADKIKGQYGKIFSYYDDTIRQQMVNEQKISDMMYNALKNDEFKVYYQPKYSLETEAVAGAEALVRWLSPTKGYLSPDKFIPVFEKNGFITQMDIYVWETVCRDFHQWISDGGAPVAISVNVSRLDIYNPELINVLLGLIKKYDVPAKYLHLEITETAYTENPQQLIAIVNELRAKGFVVEMDDFGSGYSSLNMLSEMPIDVLKLDMRFIQTQTKSSSGKGILSFIISLAKWLNLAVVAEGVETKEQIEVLKSMDCNYVQGFYYAKPMSKEDFYKLLGKSITSEMICTNTSVCGISEQIRLMPAQNYHVMLVIDDIDTNRKELSKIFGGQFAVIEAENGEIAWNYLEKNYDKIEIVMLDLIMPVMDGFALLRKIRADERTKHLPVIITSQGDDETKRRVLAMDADDFISKPYSADIVRNHVRNVLSRVKTIQINKEKQSTED